MSIDVMARSKHYLLDAMGVSQWQKRPNTLYSNTDSFLLSNDPKFCAKCLVLLPNKPPAKDTAEDKILTGMLKVLNLKPEVLSIAWISPAVVIEPFSYSSLIQTLHQWAPYTLLVMGQALNPILFKENIDFDQSRLTLHRLENLDTLIQVTYHPAELEKNPKDKRKAFRDLQVLKEQLTQVKYHD